jgi:hypothetical protein
MYSKIDPNNIIMVTLEEILEEQRKAFKVHRQAAEKRKKVEEVRELQECNTPCYENHNQVI